MSAARTVKAADVFGVEPSLTDGPRSFERVDENCYRLTIDLERQTIATPDGALVVAFDVDPFRKHCLLHGLDDIGLTLQHADEIREFEARRLAEQPWLA